MLARHIVALVAAAVALVATVSSVGAFCVARASTTLAPNTTSGYFYICVPTPPYEPEMNLYPHSLATRTLPILRALDLHRELQLAPPRRHCCNEPRPKNHQLVGVVFTPAVVLEAEVSRALVLCGDGHTHPARCRLAGGRRRSAPAAVAALGEAPNLAPSARTVPPPTSRPPRTVTGCTDGSEASNRS